MELIDALQQVIQEAVRASSPTDLVIGTVTKTDPLEVTERNVRDPIPAQALLLTEPVVEKKVEGRTACLEHGKPLPVRGGYTILNRGLEVGDKIIMLKVLSGQCYIILSRVFEGG